MANYVSFTPTTIIGKAMFNFDAMGGTDFMLSGTVAVSVSDAFTSAQYLAFPSSISPNTYTSLSSGKGGWTTAQLANIDAITHAYSQFINLGFSPVSNYSGYTPANVGNSSDINISLIHRTDLPYSGISALNTDASFLYAGSRGDVVLNVDGFGSTGLSNDSSLTTTSFGGHTLMHEIGHSLGLSHPHSAIINGIPTLTSDYSATTSVGFDKLGFHISSPAGMNKEYFTIMSYDDEKPASGPDTFAQTPMILDVIALQGAYGEGSGTSGNANDVITPGASTGVTSFRTYFDTGGTDTIDLSNYAQGAYLHMGTTIAGATHLVGVSMSAGDFDTMANLAGDPSSLRWFYGEFENATGSPGADRVIGNRLNNVINGGNGNDFLVGDAGNDTLDGGGGVDIAAYAGNRSAFTMIHNSDGSYALKDNTGSEGTDTLTNIERLQFADKKIAIDLSPAGSAGKTAELIVAAFGAAALANTQYAAIGLRLFDGGYSLQQVARMCIDSGQISAPDDTSFVTAVWLNVVGSPIDPANLVYFTGRLQGIEPMSQAALLELAATCPTNQDHIGLIGLASTGIEYA